MSLAHIRQVSPGLTKSTNFTIRTSTNGATEHRRGGCTKTQASKAAIQGRLTKVTRSLSPTESPSAKSHSASPAPQWAVPVNIENSSRILPANNGNFNLYPALVDYSGSNSNIHIFAFPDGVDTHNSETDTGMIIQIPLHILHLPVPITAKCAKIVDIIRNMHAPRATKRFMGIDSCEYAYIVQALDEAAGEDSPLYKARLAYFPRDHELQVAMPDDVHESPFNELQAELRGVLRRIPLPTFSNGRRIVVIRLPGNMQVIGKTISAYPDAHVRISSQSSDPSLSYPLPYFFLECAFSQTESSVNRKFMEYAASFPKAVALMKINVKESPPYYRAPGHDSDVAKRLANKDIIPWKKWMPKKTHSNALGPVITHGISWIDISAIEVQIWVRSGRDPIDITAIGSTDTQEYAFGTLYPTLDMSDVDSKLRASLGRIRDIAVRYAEKTLASQGASGLVEDNSDSTEDDSEYSDSEDGSDSNESGKDDDDDLGLDWASGSESDGNDARDRPGPHGLAEARAWSPPNPLFDWETILIEDMAIATWRTAYRRYCDWHAALRKRETTDIASGRLGSRARSKRRRA